MSPSGFLYSFTVPWFPVMIETLLSFGMFQQYPSPNRVAFNYASCSKNLTVSACQALTFRPNEDDGRNNESG